METTEINNDKRVKIYEAGFLLVPSIAEEHVAGEVERIKSLIETHDGVIITEDFPKLRPLAYTMKKAATGQNLKFDKAYFGWIKFETTPVQAAEIKNTLEKNPSVLRSMVITTVRENTQFVQKPIFRPAPSADAPKTEDGVKAEKMSEEEIDKTIENLVVE